MKGGKRFLLVALATAMLAPSKARARARAYTSVDPARPAHKQERRRVQRARQAQSLPRTVSPCGRHVVEVNAGAVFVDGRRIHPTGGPVHLIGTPRFRSDGKAVAWLERAAGSLRLVVLPALDEPASEALPYNLPTLPGQSQLFWAGRERIVIGPDLLVPHAVASWTTR